MSDLGVQGDPAAAAGAVLFDAYGTLFTLEGIEAACREVLAGSGVEPAAFSALWRAKQLEYSVHRSLLGPAHYVDFARVTAEALDYALARHGVAPADPERAALLAVWHTPGADPAAADILAALAPLRRAILSNGTPGMLARAVATAGLDGVLEAVLSADEVGVYKPDRRVYALGTARFGLPPDRIWFVSANGWDAVGASAFGYRVCWLNRARLPAERHGPPPAVVIASLAELPGLVAGSPPAR